MAKIENCGPKLSETEASNLEMHICSILPKEYRQFLLEFNGGTPIPNTVEVPGFHESPTDVQVLFGVGRSVESSCIEWNLRNLAERLEKKLVPIACDSGGNVFCISLRTHDLGAILYFDLQSVFGDLTVRPDAYNVASSFNGFLKMLKHFE